MRRIIICSGNSSLVGHSVSPVAERSCHRRTTGILWERPLTFGNGQTWPQLPLWRCVKYSAGRLHNQPNLTVWWKCIIWHAAPMWSNVYMIEYHWYNTITLLWAHGANTLFWCERCGRLDSVFPRFACLQSCSLSKGSSAALPPVTDNRPWQSSVTSCRVVDVIQLSTIEHDFSLLSRRKETLCDFRASCWTHKINQNYGATPSCELAEYCTCV